MLPADLHVLDLDHGSLRLEMTAGKLVGRHDAMAFLHAIHCFEIGRIERIGGPHASQHRVHYARGAVDGESHFHQPVDDR